MKKKITNNLGLKIISLFASIILWVVVTGISDPAVTQTFYNIPVKLMHTEIVTDKNCEYEVLENTDVLQKVTIKAPHSVITQIHADDIEAVADFNNIGPNNTVKIELSAGSVGDSLQSIIGSSDILKLDVQNRKTKTFALKTDVTGSVSEGYIIGDAEANQNLVRVTGAESLIDQIAKASVEVDVTGFTESVSTSSEIKFFDAEGKNIKSDKFTMNIKNAYVNVEILKEKDVTVVFSASGEAYPGYRATGNVVSSVDTVKICGEESILSGINSLVIPDSAIDITGQKETFVTSVNIAAFLPEGVKLVDSADNTAPVTVEIEAESTKRIALDSEDISVLNLSDEYKATISLEDNTFVELIGLDADLNLLNKSNIYPTVNVATYMDTVGMETIEDGFYSMYVDFVVPDGVTIVDQVVATIHIQSKQ